MTGRVYVNLLEGMACNMAEKKSQKIPEKSSQNEPNSGHFTAPYKITKLTHITYLRNL